MAKEELEEMRKALLGVGNEITPAMTKSYEALAKLLIEAILKNKEINKLLAESRMTLEAGASSLGDNKNVAALANILTDAYKANNELKDKLKNAQEVTREIKPPRPGK